MITFSFGHTPEMADMLLAAVIRGDKTATCSALRDYADDSESMPQVGRRDCVLDSKGQRRAIIETTKVEILRFEDVPVEYAAHAGEGFATIEDWRRGYRGELERYGGFETGIQMVCERFRLVEVLENSGKTDK